VVVKIFRFNDEPLAKGLSKEEAERYASSLNKSCMFEESRIKEIEMEKMYIRTVKEKETENKKRLQEMKEDVDEYVPPIECSTITYYNGDKSEERNKQKKRESTIFAMQYVKESQIPQFPKELEEKYFNESSDDILVIKITPSKVSNIPPPPLVMVDKPKQFENKFSSQLAQALAQTLINTISVIPRLPMSAPVANNKLQSGKQKYTSVEDMPKPPNYKTVPCRLFHSTVGCSRGEFCHFIHDEKFAGKEIPQYELQKRKRPPMPMQQMMMPPPRMMPYQMNEVYPSNPYYSYRPYVQPPTFFPMMERPNNQ
jgi:hypothetical protein